MLNTLKPNSTSTEAIQKPNKIQKVLVIGASGYLGRSLCDVMAPDFELLRLDIAEAPGPGDFLLGSVTDRKLLNDACQRVDALVLAHMAPNRTEAYDWPDFSMDINVKGVALALEAAARNNIRRVILISSVAVVWGHVEQGTYLDRNLPSRPTDVYGMTKMLQEEVACFYNRVRGIEIAVLRPAYILREDSLINKYGENRTMVTWQCIDPRDIGRAVTRSLQVQNLEFEVFYLMAGPGVEKHVDVDSSHKRLGWKPEHLFLGLPVEQI